MMEIKKQIMIERNNERKPNVWKEKRNIKRTTERKEQR